MERLILEKIYDTSEAFKELTVHVMVTDKFGRPVSSLPWYSSAFAG